MPSPDADYPDINGRRYSWASVIINIGNAQFIGVKSIDWNEKVDPTKIHGTGQNIIGATAGMYDADGNIEIYQLEADNITSQLGDGWGNRTLPIQVQYLDDDGRGGDNLTTYDLSVRLIAATGGGTEGSEAITSKFTMFFLDTIVKNGVRMVPAIQVAGNVNGSIF